MNSLSKLKQCLDYNEKTPVINLTGVFNKDKFNNIIEGPQLTLKAEPDKASTLFQYVDF